MRSQRSAPAPFAVAPAPDPLADSLTAAGSSAPATLRLGLFAALLAAVFLLFAGSASAATVWNLGMHHNQTNFPPGGKAQYWFNFENVGSSASSGPLKLTLNLPPGLTSSAVVPGEEFLTLAPLTWNCTGANGASTVECSTTAGSIPRHTSASLIVEVAVDPGASGVLTATATLSGGGALLPATAAEPTEIDPDPAPFGILTASFTPDFLDADGLTPRRRAGEHPPLLTVPFDFASVPYPTAQKPTQNRESGSVRNVTFDLPPGFIGDPTAVGECTAAQYTVGLCPPSSQVGRFDGTLFTVGAGLRYNFTTGVFNMVHPRGSITDLGFQLGGNPVHVKASLDPANRYAIITTTSDINESLPPFNSKVTIWGVPADPSHDSERCAGFSASAGSGKTDAECSTDHTPQPFLALPSQCEDDNVFRLHHYDSWQEPGTFGPEIDYTMPGKVTGCEIPRFEPDVEIVPTGRQANTPTGLDVHVKIAQNDNPDALATPPVQRFTVTLPEGMSFSPAFADGLQACTLAQAELGNNDPVRCPDASRIGEVEVALPILPKPARGSMYLAAQGDNPFHSLFALYLVLEDTEERGALVKIPGRIDVDPTTGQIVTSFEDTPQFPFEDLTLKFRSGPRAPLISPPSCGTQTIAVEVASYAQPDDPVDASNTYEVTEGPNGSPCPPDPARRPFAPDFSGGTLNPVAGAYSTFLFSLRRTDSEQEFSQVTTALPPGLLAKIAGIPLCPDIALESISTKLGEGAAEQAAPACPALSQIGSVSAGLGAGPGPNYFPGRVYLAGPYKGAPLSLAIVVPGLAGPFDLGSTVVRVALRVDPDTSRVTAVSDPFPTILHGVILRVRDVRLRLDRPDTTLNPTNCAPTTLNADITGVGGDLLSTADDSLFAASDYFQVGDCGRLPFKPQIFFKLKGGTNRGDHPAFFSRVLARPGDANFGTAIVALPKSEFLENAHIGTVCTRVQFRADQCPAASIYGHARAVTPLLDDPVEGDLILRSSDHPLPDLVARLRGQISANLVGRIDSINGGIRSSFETIPDVPVTEFTLTMKGGDKGLLVNSRNLCKAPARADVKFTSQSNKFLRLRPLMQTSCKGKKAKRKRSDRRRG